MNANDLITDFYNSHPAAIHSCIKAMKTIDKKPSPVPPSPHLSAKEHLLQFKLAQAPLSPTITNSSTSSQDITLLANKWPPLISPSLEPLIPALQLEDSPLPQYSPLAPQTASPSSGYTPKEMTCISSLLSLIETNSTSTSTGQPGHQDHMKMPQMSTTKLSKYQQKENQSSEPEYNINAATHQDTRPYLRRTKAITSQKPAQRQAPRQSTPTTNHPKNQKQEAQEEAVNQDQASLTRAHREATTNQLFKRLRKKLADKCAKAFVAMHAKWESYSKRFEDITVAKLFRRHDEDMALYLLRIQPQIGRAHV